MFSSSERKIYGPYHNGEREMYADPLALRRKLSLHMGGDVKAVIDAYNSDDVAAKDRAATILFEAIIKAFGIKKPFDPTTGQGFTESDLLRLWEEFQNWQDQKKNPPGNSPTSSQPTPPSGLPRQPNIGSAAASKG